MFPRPSRFLRLGAGVSCLGLFLFCFYFINNDHNDEHKVLSDFPVSGYGIMRIAQVLNNERHLEDSLRLLADRPDDIRSKTTNASNTRDHVQTNIDPTNTASEFEFRVRIMLKNAEQLDKKKSKNDASVDNSGDTPKLVNPHNFRYIHNPASLCERSPPRLLIYIHSAPVNLKKRQAVRQTWGQPRILSLYNASLVFVLGQTNTAFQALIDMEAQQYGDIVQESFHDSYRNLTHKGVAGLKWASNQCKSAKFVLKTDDDILLDIVSLLEHFYMNVIPSHGKQRLVLCNVWTRMKVLRDTKSKWYISKEEFPPDYFPAYCSGSAFFLSGDLVNPLYRTALTTPFFWVDDYYITGSLVNQLKVSHVRLNPVYLMDFNVVDDRLRNDSKDLMVFHVKKLSKFISLWPRLVQRHPGMAAFLDDSMSHSAQAVRQQLLKSHSVHDIKSGSLEDSHRYESHQITSAKGTRPEGHNQTAGKSSGLGSNIESVSKNVDSEKKEIGNVHDSSQVMVVSNMGGPEDNTQNVQISKPGEKNASRENTRSKSNLNGHAQTGSNLPNEDEHHMTSSSKFGNGGFPNIVESALNSSSFLSQRVNALSRSIG